MLESTLHQALARELREEYERLHSEWYDSVPLSVLHRQWSSDYRASALEKC